MLWIAVEYIMWDCLQGLNLDGIRSPLRKTPELALVRTFPDLLSTLRTVLGPPLSECLLVLLLETGP